ncbi:hypothetical protein [Ferrovibrio terrae]
MLQDAFLVAQTIGGAASVPLLVILWRLDRRISKLETIVELILLKERV